MKKQHRILLTPLLLMGSAIVSLRGGTFTDESYTDPALGTMHYRVYLPDQYKSKGAPVPVILYLHSAAERGDTVEAVFANNGWTNTWVTKLVDETQNGKHQAVLVIPESGSWQVWNSMTAGDNWGVGDYTDETQKPISPRLQLAVDILDRVIASHNIDKNRVYLTGASMGGYGTWDALARFPKKFAAAMPLAGAGNLDAARKVFNGKPIWIFHGVEDTLISTRNSDDLAAAMRATGGRPIYSRVAGQGHGGFDLFYTPGYFTVDSPSAPGGKGKDVYDWLFSQTFASEGTVIHPSAPVVVEMSSMPLRRRIVFLGDSIVDGHTSLLLLAHALRQREGAPPVLVNAGVGGNTLRQMRERATRDVLPHDPDTACISAGVNDAHQGVAPEAFEADLVALIGFLREHRIEPVLATPTPLAEDRPPEVRERLRAYVEIVKVVGARCGIPVARCHETLASLAAAGETVLGNDGIHPNFAGHRGIARAMGEALGFGSMDMACDLDALPLDAMPGIVTRWRMCPWTDEGAGMDDEDRGVPLTLPAAGVHSGEWLEQERQRGFAVELPRTLGLNASQFFGVATIRRERAGQAFVNTGAGLQEVWLNGTSIWRSNGEWTGWHAGKERIPVDFPAGESLLSIRCKDSFFLSVTDDNAW